MLTTDGVASADSGMRRIQRAIVESRVAWREGAWVLHRGGARCPQRASGLGSETAGAALCRDQLSICPPESRHKAAPTTRKIAAKSAPFAGTGQRVSSSIPQSRVSARSALTLIELLAVIGIIGVLAAITFGVARGVQERAGIGKARVEIAAIAQALEAYRVKYGDYPQTSSAATMLQCLIGRRGPTGAALTDKPLIDLARFSTVNDSDPFTVTTAVLMDPFGKSYRYLYKPTASWRNPAFLLISGGPDGVILESPEKIPDDGFLASSFEAQFDSRSGTGNSDNIYDGRN